MDAADEIISCRERYQESVSDQPRRGSAGRTIENLIAVGITEGYADLVSRVRGRGTACRYRHRVRTAAHFLFSIRRTQIKNPSDKTRTKSQRA